MLIAIILSALLALGLSSRVMQSSEPIQFGAAAQSAVQTSPRRGSRFSDLETAAIDVAEPVRWGGKGVVAFVSGNHAMAPFMLNEMMHVARQAVPFRVLWVPLDMKALHELLECGNGTIYDGIATTGEFSPDRSDFREPEYNRMAMVKWDVSIQLLGLGYDVLLLDPDLVILRNPIPYFETLGVCDLNMQLDSLIDPTADNVLANGGFSFQREGFANYYNTGGVLMRAGAGGATRRVLRWLRGFRDFAESEYAHGSQLDDQALFNRCASQRAIFSLCGLAFAAPVLCCSCFPLPSTWSQILVVEA